MTTPYESKDLMDFLTYQKRGDQIIFDAEGSSYLFLAYKQKIDHFIENKALFPYYPDINRLFLDVCQTLEKHDLFHDNRPQEIVKFDLENMRAVYQKKPLDGNSVSENSLLMSDHILEFFEYVLSGIKAPLSKAMRLNKTISDNIKIEHVNIHPPYDQEGYLLTIDPLKTTYDIYRYKKNYVESIDEHDFNIELAFIESMDILSSSTSGIQTLLSRRFPELPVPKVFLANYDDLKSENVPFEETLLPLTKRLLVKELNAA